MTKSRTDKYNTDGRGAVKDDETGGRETERIWSGGRAADRLDRMIVGRGGRDGG